MLNANQDANRDARRLAETHGGVLTGTLSRTLTEQTGNGSPGGSVTSHRVRGQGSLSQNMLFFSTDHENQWEGLSS